MIGLLFLTTVALMLMALLYCALKGFHRALVTSNVLAQTGAFRTSQLRFAQFKI